MSVDVHKFSTGAVRSTDADAARYDLITPIGLAAVAEIYQAGFDDRFLNPDLKVYHWIGYAKKFTYDFLAGGGKRDLAMGAVCVLEAASCEIRGDSGVPEDEHDPLGCGYDFIPTAALRAVAEAYAEGAVKYKPFNWEAGMPVSDLLNHGLRHLDKFMEGDETEPHLGHAAWNWLAALHSLELWPHLNTDLRGPGCTPPRDEAEATAGASSPGGQDPSLPPNCWRNEKGQICGIVEGEPSQPRDEWREFCDYMGWSAEPPRGEHATKTVFCHHIPTIDDALNGVGPFPVLYISGPMSGHRDLNFPAFNKAAEKLRQIGFPVLNPADFGACGGLSWEENLHRDLAFLGFADVLVQLPGWEDSRGASLEYNTAVGLGKGVTSVNTLIDEWQ